MNLHDDIDWVNMEFSYQLNHGRVGKDRFPILYWVPFIRGRIKLSDLNIRLNQVTSHPVQEKDGKRI